MTKNEASAQFKECYPEIVTSKDKGLKRLEWACYTDSLCKDGQITSKQYSTWTQPAWVNKVVKRKVFEIQQYLFGTWETVSNEETPKDAKRCLKDYRVNQPEYPTRIKTIWY